jgi:hypothetical protein
LVTYPTELSSEGRVGQLAPVKFHHILIRGTAALFLASPDQAPCKATTKPKVSNVRNNIEIRQKFFDLNSCRGENNGQTNTQTLICLIII